MQEVSGIAYCCRKPDSLEVTPCKLFKARNQEPEVPASVVACKRMEFVNPRFARAQQSHDDPRPRSGLLPAILE